MNEHQKRDLERDLERGMEPELQGMYELIRDNLGVEGTLEFFALYRTSMIGAAIERDVTALHKHCSEKYGPSSADVPEKVWAAFGTLIVDRFTDWYQKEIKAEGARRKAMH